MTQIGPYRVLEELARGGMGAVYRVLAPDGRPAALKLLLAHRAANPRARERFQVEAHTLARLRHPNVVSILGVGEHEGAPWIALDFVDGESLEERLRHGPLPIAQAVQIGADLAKALGYVHTCRVLHRDLKPGNVLLKGERALLTDFGIAYDAGSAARLTATGAFLGTPGYWPPEQARGERAKVGPASDLYGLGAVLYACLTGKPPIQSASLQEHLSLAVDYSAIKAPNQVRREVPRWLSALCMRCLAVEPRDRPRSATEVELALLAGGSGAEEAPRRSYALAGLMLGAAALIALVAWWAGSGARPAEVASVAPESTSPPREQVTPPEPPPSVPVAKPPTEPDPSPKDSAEALVDRAIELGRQGKHEQALELLGRALELSPSSHRAYANRGTAHYHLKRYRKAQDDYDRAIALHPKQPGYWARRGKAKRLAGDTRKALSDYDQALELDPDNSFALYERATALSELGNYARALVDYNLVLELKPRDRFALVNRSVAKRRLGRQSSALSDLRRAEQLFAQPHVTVHANLCACLYELERLDEAEVEIDKALQLSPRDAVSRYWKGRILAAREEPHEALSFLDEALRLNPRLKDAWFKRGQIYHELGRHQAAVSDFTRAIELSSRFAQAYYCRGNAHVELGAREAALTDYTRALRLRPDKVEILLNRGALLRKAGDTEAALADYERGLELDPESPELHLNRGNLLNDLGRHADALVMFEWLAAYAGASDELRARAQRGLRIAREGLAE